MLFWKKCLVFSFKKYFLKNKVCVFITVAIILHIEVLSINVVFNVVFSGESGLGKSTLINSLFLTDLYAGRNFSSAKGNSFYGFNFFYFIESTVLLISSLIIISIKHVIDQLITVFTIIFFFYHNNFFNKNPETHNHKKN